MVQIPSQKEYEYADTYSNIYNYSGVCIFQTIPGVTAVVEVMALVGRWRLVSEYRNYSAV